jgi:ectoine hydroxylase-related dioxygenase (phytanoyl-CoA dioxygenase family)
MLERQALAEFEKDGVICIRSALSADWLDLLTRGVDKVIAAPADQCADCSIPSTTGRFFNGFFQSLGNADIARFIHESPVKELARALAHSQHIRFFYDQLLAKSPNTGQRTPWHSDRDYFPLGGVHIVSLWIPLDPVTRKTGTLEFIRGSHQLSTDELVARCPQADSIDKDKGMYVLPDFERFPDLYDIVSWDLQPGDVLAFHVDTLHSGGANGSSQQWRRALATRWLGDDVYVKESGPHILEKAEIAGFLERQGKGWSGTLDDRLFPLL